MDPAGSTTRLMKPISLLACLLLQLLPRSAAATVAHGRDANTLWIDNAQLRIEIDLASGRYDCRWRDKTSLAGAGCGARLADGTDLAAASCARHICADSDIQPLSDPLGAGIEVVIHHLQNGAPELRQRVDVYDDQPLFVTSIELVSPTAISTNHIEVIATDTGVQMPVGRKPSVLFVPFDNDSWVRYNNHHDPAKDPDSYEVTAIYDNLGRRGVIVGSITHDRWKTGIEARGISDGSVEHLKVYGGATGSLSRDSQPHGMVTGTTIASPRIWVGSFSDWRDGMDAFGQANARVHPPLAWNDGVIFGWNSWAAYGGKIDFARYIAVSDILAKNLPTFGNGKPVFINWDSGWNKCSEQQLRDAARHAHQNGQKAGIYFCPFAGWGQNPQQAVEGTNGRYHYGDILLRDSAGAPVPKIDGGQPLDPTHPGTLQRIDWQLARFVDWGYDFVKLDFLNFGSLESAHYDPAITTGIAAYNLGMQRIAADLDPSKIGRPIFISLSIAPLFPGGYGHARRISCDTFGALRDSEYMLNSLTYGWWMNKTIYAFNDPDHTVLTSSKNPGTLEEARTRLNASIIAGTMLIDSDDLTDPAALQRAAQLLTNAKINALTGHTFRPVEADGSDRAADCFICRESDQIVDVAFFNFDSQKACSRRIDLQRLGLSDHGKCRVEDLWSGATSDLEGSVSVDLGARASKMMRITAEK